LSNEGPYKINYSNEAKLEQQFRHRLIASLDSIKAELAATNSSSGAVWGSVTGTLSDQTDLVTEFATKEDLLTNSAGLRAALSDETGTGVAVFNNTPTLITPVLGAATGTSLNLSGLTASEIVATDGSKNLSSLAVATYPSLTELTYVKDVTSAIQTQLNAKATNTGTIAGADWTGSSNPTGFSGALSTHVFRYSYDPNTKVCTCVVSFSGTSNATTLTATLPYQAAAFAQTTICGGVTDNSAASLDTGRLVIASGGTTADFNRNRNNTAYTAGGTKTWFGMFSYITA
jgi:hypothetical protein